MKISGFTFGYNLISGGYPIVEAVGAVRPYVDEVVAVDCQSTDDTPRVLGLICDRVVSGPAWSERNIQHKAFDLHREYCQGDIIILFEADEVYDENLLSEIHWTLSRGHTDLGVYRIQVEQNFQRVRSYPEPVYRVFPKGGGNYQNHPMHCPEGVFILPPDAGLLWDCAGCFRDNWLKRKENQTIVWGSPRHLMVADHFTKSNEISQEEEILHLNDDHWTWKKTPLKLPKILLPLVGKTKYEVGI